MHESVALTKEFVHGKGKNIGLELNFRILQQKTWPISLSSSEPELTAKDRHLKKRQSVDEDMKASQFMQVSLPKPLSTVFHQFQSFYLSKACNKGRKLDYFAEKGSCVLKATLGSTFHVRTTVSQALVLLQFNGPVNKSSVKLLSSALQQKTQLTLALLQSALATLS